MSNKRKEAQMEGSKATTQSIRETVLTQLEINAKLHEMGKKKYSICIWGTHGIGKTDIIKSLRKETINGKPIRIVSINPAQNEEMGDLLGMPSVKDGRTIFCKPDWVPDENEEGYGILFIDDFNRANERVIQGTMQLIQDYQLSSWKLPANWTIVCSANPETSDYDVTNIDEAVKTRLFHYNMLFDLDEWLKWASSADIDERILYFISEHGNELLGSNEGQANPRAFTAFAESVTLIKDWKLKDGSSVIVNPQVIDRLRATRCPEGMYRVFQRFIMDDSYTLPKVEDLVEGKVDIDKTFEEIKKKSSMAVSTTRVILNRLVNYIGKNFYKKDLGNAKGANLLENICKICVNDMIGSDTLKIFQREIRETTVRDSAGNVKKLPTNFISQFFNKNTTVVDSNGKSKRISIMLKTNKALI